MTVTRAERFLPLTCLAAALCLFISEFMTTFEVSVPVQGPQCTLDAADRHHYALAVLAVFAVGAMVAAISWGSKPAAIGCAIAGALALILFLTVDLPDATASGALDTGCSAVTGSFVDADVVPQAGFWFELIGALGLALTGAALASLNAEQLAQLAPRWLRGGGSGSPPGPDDQESRARRPQRTRSRQSRDHEAPKSESG